MLFGRRKQIVKRILIVEDEPLVAFDNETMVADAGYEVVATVDTYEEAVSVLDAQAEKPAGEERAESRGVDLVLTDITLSGDRTGHDVAREAGRRGIPVLFVSAAPPKTAVDGAIGYLLKPYQERTLKSALKAVDDRLAGKRAKAPDGLFFYETQG